jgi:putative (di)nucleoside polyphosphate hydrolase
MSARPDRESLPYRDCVGVAVFNQEGNVFIGRRKPDEGTEDRTEVEAPWQMPQGGIDKGEDPLRAALRELYEETNITAVSLLAEAPEWIYYDLPDEALGIALRGKYRGQRQRWFAFAFTGKDSEIDVLTPACRVRPASSCRSRSRPMTRWSTPLPTFPSASPTFRLFRE